MFIPSSPQFFQHVYDLTLNPYWLDCLSPLHLALLLGICLIPSSGRHSFASSCLIKWFYFYEISRLVTLPDLAKVVLCRKCFTLSSANQSYML